MYLSVRESIGSRENLACGPRQRADACPPTAFRNVLRRRQFCFCCYDRLMILPPLPPKYTRQCAVKETVAQST
jgi:hypothetical protein